MKTNTINWGQIIDGRTVLELNLLTQQNYNTEGYSHQVGGVHHEVDGKNGRRIYLVGFKHKTTIVKIAEQAGGKLIHDLSPMQPEVGFSVWIPTGDELQTHNPIA